MADDVTKYSNRLERQRTRGLKYSLDAVDSLYANLSATQAGLARTLTSENNRTLSKLAAMASKIAAQSVRSVNTASSNMVGSYGALYGGQVAQKMDVAAANSEAVGAAGVAGLQTGKGLIKAGNSAMAIQQAGVADAQAAAQYALAQASIARAQADADAVAALKAQQAAAGINNSYPGLSAVARVAGDISKTARRVIRDVLEESGKDFEMATVIERITKELGITDEGQLALVRYITQSIYTRDLWYGGSAAKGMDGRNAEIQLILDAVSSLYSSSISDKDMEQLRLVIGGYLKDLYSGTGGTTPSGDGNDNPLSPPPAGPPSIYGMPIRTEDAQLQPGANIYGGEVRTEAAQLPSGYSLWGQTPPPSTTPLSNIKVSPTGSGPMPSYSQNLSAGIELYILTHPGATKAEAEMVVKRNLASGGDMNYVEALAQYKS